MRNFEKYPVENVMTSVCKALGEQILVLLAFRTRRNRRYRIIRIVFSLWRSGDPATGEFGGAKLDPEATRLASLSHASKNEEHPMAIEPGNPMSALAEPPKDSESEMREAVVDDADKTNGEDRTPFMATARRSGWTAVMI